MRNNLRIILFVSVILIAAVSLTVVVETKRLRAQATSLLHQTMALNPDVKTEDLRQRWKHEFPKYYVESNEHSFGVHLDNAKLAKWRMVKAALLSVDVFGSSGRITDVDLLYYSSSAKAPPGIAFHESLHEPTSPKDCTFRLQPTNAGTPWRAYLNFQYQNRTEAFFNIRLSCLSSFTGCETPQLLLPALSNLQSSCTQVEHLQHTSAEQIPTDSSKSPH